MSHLKVTTEVWALAADSLGIWLISDSDAWRSGPIDAESEPHIEVERLIRENDAERAGSTLAAIHSTSWRRDSDSIVLTYVAAFATLDYARSIWPAAKPVTVPLTAAVGRPPVHPPTDAPTPRYIDVLIHAIRHLRLLLDYDAGIRDSLDDAWRGHLAPLEPALAGMYDPERSTIV